MTTLLRRVLTIARWLPDYDAGTLRRDVVAGLSVGVMLIPQGMAYALLGGLPPIYGLYASLVPLLVYPIFGTSRQLAVGIVALDMVIVAAGVGALAEPGTERYIALVVTLAAMVGVLQLLMAAARLGAVADLLSRPVIVGFTMAAALIIAASQLGTLLGVETERSEYVLVMVRQVAGHLGQVHALTLALGAASIAVLLALKRWAPRVSGPLVVVVLTTAAVWALGLDGHGVEVTGAVPGGLPEPALPALELGDLRSLLSTAVTLALIQFMSAISLGRVFSAKHRYTIRPNQELLGLGAANVAGSLFRSLPVSASFSRSAVNDRAGAQTPMANVVAAALVALTLLVLTPAFERLPLAALAAIIIVSALGLIDVREIRYLFRTKRRDGIVAALTTAATLGIGIQEGIFVGVGASAVAILYRLSRPYVAELGHLPGTRAFRDRSRLPDAEPVEGVLVLRVDASFSFFNATYFRDFILRKSEESRTEVRAVVIDGKGINDLDTTALEALHELIGTLREWDIEIFFTSLKGPVRDVLSRSELTDELDDACFQLSPHHAVRYVLKQLDEEEGTDRLAAYDGRTQSQHTEPTASSPDDELDDEDPAELS